MLVTVGPKVDILIEKLTQFATLVQATEYQTIDEVLVPETTSSPADALSLPTWGKLKTNPIYTELHELINEIDLEHRCELLALIWLGRGDYPYEEWVKALEKAKQYPPTLILEYIITLPDACKFLMNGLCIIREKDKT